MRDSQTEKFLSPCGPWRLDWTDISIYCIEQLVGILSYTEYEGGPLRPN